MEGDAGTGERTGHGEENRATREKFYEESICEEETW